ncbi:MAG: DUF2207 domain-containing protein [Acholeplasmataceae bacterium]|nr:DUF2207 domain-containing protein [Acholeplasmataceae bacterium]
MSYEHSSKSPSAGAIIVVIYRFGMLILAFFTIFFTTVIKSCEANPRIKIDSYEAMITLDDQGDMHVVETWTMDYKDALRVRFRDIDFNKYNVNDPFDFDRSNLAAFDTDSLTLKITKNGEDVTDRIMVGTSYNHQRDELGHYISCEPYRSDCESIFTDFQNAWGLEGDVVFEYGYTINGAVTVYEDIAELNWKMFDYAENTVEHVMIDITLPENTHDDEQLMVWGHGVDKGTVTPVGNNRVVIEAFDVRENMVVEFRILAEKDLFPLVRNQNIVIHEDATKASIMAFEARLIEQTEQRILISRLVFGASGLSILLMGLIFLLVRKLWFKPFVSKIDEDYFRDLPSDHSPAEIGYLIRYKWTNEEDVTATLLDLIRRGHIRVQKASSAFTNDEDALLTLSDDQPEDRLKQHEKDLVKWFFGLVGKDQPVTAKQIEMYGAYDHKKASAFQGAASRFKASVKRVSDRHVFFDEDVPQNRVRARRFVWIPILMLLGSLMLASVYQFTMYVGFFVYLVVIIMYLRIVKKQQRRSKHGELLYLKWMAFKRYLEHFADFSDDPIGGIAVWEHYLVYATVFGIADTVMKQLEVRLKDEKKVVEHGTFMHMQSTGYMGQYRLSTWRFHRRIRNAHLVSHNQIRTHQQAQRRQALVNSFSNTGSSSGRGGGFGGGSSFGGGGGGGRSR